MKRVLVDSSIWINYFNSPERHTDLTELIKNDQICINNLVLSELVPFLKVKKQDEVVNLLLEIPNEAIHINWEFIVHVQVQNLKNGINKVGIPDLIILDNVIANNLVLYTADKHFQLMRGFISFDLYEEL